MFCDKCGTENPDDGAFCQKCGASLTNAPKKKGAKTKASNPAESNSSADIFGFSIKVILLLGAAAALAIALLTGILAAAGAGEFTDGAMKGAYFFDHLLDGVLFAGILIGFAALVSSRKP